MRATLDGSSSLHHLGVFVHCECQQCSQVAGVRLRIPQQLAARNCYLPLQLLTPFLSVLKLLLERPMPYCADIVPNAQRYLLRISKLQ